MDPFKGANVTLVMPEGILIDLKSHDWAVSNQEEAYYVPGGGGFEKSYLTATSNSVNFAGVALNDAAGGAPPIPASYFGADGSPFTAFEGVHVNVNWRTGEVWHGTANIINANFNTQGNTLVAMSGTMKINGRVMRNSSSSSSSST